MGEVNDEDILWEECMSPDNIPYYYNRDTQESSWERPSSLLRAGAQAKLDAKAANKTAKANTIHYGWQANEGKSGAAAAVTSTYNSWSLARLESACKARQLRTGEAGQMRDALRAFDSKFALDAGQFERYLERFPEVSELHTLKMVVLLRLAKALSVPGIDECDTKDEIIGLLRDFKSPTKPKPIPQRQQPPAKPVRRGSRGGGGGGVGGNAWRGAGSPPGRGRGRARGPSPIAGRGPSPVSGRGSPNAASTVAPSMARSPEKLYDRVPMLEEPKSGGGADVGLLESLTGQPAKNASGGAAATAPKKKEPVLYSKLPSFAPDQSDAKPHDVQLLDMAFDLPESYKQASNRSLPVARGGDARRRGVSSMARGRGRGRGRGGGRGNVPPAPSKKAPPSRRTLNRRGGLGETPTVPANASNGGDFAKQNSSTPPLSGQSSLNNSTDEPKSMIDKTRAALQTSLDVDDVTPPMYFDDDDDDDDDDGEGDDAATVKSVVANYQATIRERVKAFIPQSEANFQTLRRERQQQRQRVSQFVTVRESELIKLAMGATDGLSSNGDRSSDGGDLGLMWEEVDDELEEKDEDKERMVKERGALVRRLLADERRHCERLAGAINSYLRPLCVLKGHKDVRKDMRRIDEKGSMTLLLSTIELLREQFVDVLKGIDKEVLAHEREGDACIARAFGNIHALLLLCSVYLDHETAGVGVLDAAKASATPTFQYVRSLEEKHAAKLGTLLSTVHAPPTHVSSYVSRLKDIVQCTPADHADYEPLCDVIALMEREVEALDANRKAAHRMRTMARAMRELDFSGVPEWAPDAQRSVLADDVVMVRMVGAPDSSTQSPRAEQCKLVVFNDCAAFAAWPPPSVKSRRGTAPTPNPAAVRRVVRAYDVVGVEGAAGATTRFSVQLESGLCLVCESVDNVPCQPLLDAFDEMLSSTDGTQESLMVPHLVASLSSPPTSKAAGGAAAPTAAKLKRSNSDAPRPKRPATADPLSSEKKSKDTMDARGHKSASLATNGAAKGGLPASPRKDGAASRSPRALDYRRLRAVPINVTDAQRKTCAEAFNLEVSIEDVLLRFVCDLSGRRGELFVTELAMCFLSEDRQQRMRLPFFDVTDITDDTASLSLKVAHAGDTPFVFGRFRSGTKLNECTQFALYIRNHQPPRKVEYFAALEVKVLVSTSKAKNAPFTLRPCHLKVTSESIQCVFSRTEKSVYELRHVRRWAHKGPRLSIVLGDSTEHVRIMTETTIEAAEVVRFLHHLAARVVRQRANNETSVWGLDDGESEPLTSEPSAASGVSAANSSGNGGVGGASATGGTGSGTGAIGGVAAAGGLRSRAASSGTNEQYYYNIDEALEDSGGSGNTAAKSQHSGFVRKLAMGKKKIRQKFNN